MMDFLDPKKRRNHRNLLIVGYILVGIAIVLATTLLIYIAEGFDLKKGKIVQNGLVFVSSSPSNASVYVDGVSTNYTNTMLTLQAGTYTIQLDRDGYHTWQRTVSVAGGSVQYVDYPLLIPTTLTTTADANYATAPSFASQSNDQRWLLVGASSDLTKFDVYDLKDPKKINTNETHTAIPAHILTASQGAQTLQVVAWANDNQHMLLKHTYDGTQSEYILGDRQDMSKALNLTSSLHLTSTDQITFQNGSYDTYFVHDMTKNTLATADLNDLQSKVMLSNVLQFQARDANDIVYVAADTTNKNQAMVMVYQNNKSYMLNKIQVSSAYALGIAQYQGVWYVAASSSVDNHVYIYQNPASSAHNNPASNALVPTAVLKLNQPVTYLTFSANKQFIVAENGTHFATYDIQTDKSYGYTIPDTLDTPQQYAAWIDSYRLSYISNGKVVMFDYDGSNIQQLVAENATYAPYLAPNAQYLYTFAPFTATSPTQSPTTNVQAQLTQTPLLTTADQ